MRASSYRLEELVPHRDPMRLIDEIVSYDNDNREIVASLIVREQWRCAESAIEYMAQSAAALAGLNDKAEFGDDFAPRPGFLLGTRKLILPGMNFNPGEKLFVRAKDVFSDRNQASFECEVYRENALNEKEVLATARLNAYRPDDIKDFITESRN